MTDSQLVSAFFVVLLLWSFLLNFLLMKRLRKINRFMSDVISVPAGARYVVAPPQK